MKFDWVTNRFDISIMAWPHLYNAEMIIDIWSKWVAVTFIVIIKLGGIILSVYLDKIELVHRCDKHVHHDLHIHWQYMLNVHELSVCNFIDMDLVRCRFGPVYQSLCCPLDVVWIKMLWNQFVLLHTTQLDSLRPSDAYMRQLANHHRFR